MYHILLSIYIIMQFSRAVLVLFKQTGDAPILKQPKVWVRWCIGTCIHTVAIYPSFT